MKFLKDITNINHRDIFNKAEADLIATFANSTDKYTSHGLVTEIDKAGNINNIFNVLYENLIYSYRIPNFALETFIFVEGSFKAIFEGYQLGVRTFVMVTSSQGYYNRLIRTMANQVTNWADSKIYICYYDKNLNEFKLEYMIKDNKLQFTDKTLKELRMNNKNVSILENPPYEIGAKITIATKLAFPNAKYSILMPLAQYEAELPGGTKLFQYLKTFKTVGWTSDSAKVTQNNSIVTLTAEADLTKKDFINDFMLESFDQRYRAFYDYNIKNYRGYFFSQKTYKKPEEFNIDTDFIEGGRQVSYNGGGFTCDGFGYAWNVKKAGYESWANNIGVMNCFTKQAKDNISCWAYNYHGDKTRALATKVMWGIKQTTISSRYYMYIPQIDWDNIHINQKTLWDQGLYDEAVLAEMGLKWEGDKIVKA